MAAEPARSETAGRAAAEAAARNAYGKLLASLVRRTRDLAAAEDALADAFAAALERWPEDGPPDRPEAWLLTTARRKLIDRSRRDAVRREAEPQLALLTDGLAEAAEAGALPDHRLGLMLACADPAIDPGLRTPLMLQVVLGLDAARIGSAFLVSPAAMGQRLSRGKAAIKQAGLVFDPPGADALPARLAPVLDAVYAAYGAGWEAPAGEGKVRDLTEEARFLARLITELSPGAAEAWALFALIEYCEARAPARRDGEGRFVPLSDQDPALWDGAAIARAETALKHALGLAPPGRYALEAAIQSVHAERRLTGRTNWPAAASLYDALHQSGEAGLGAQIARACAHGEAFGADAALGLLEGLHAADHQPLEAARAHWLAAAGRLEDARAAYDRAAALSADPAVREFLSRRRAQL
ncbi:MAG: DUF6596 domain-containing protein [Oceanicaulis sp.]